MTACIHSIDALTPEWLTEVLSSHEMGKVITVEKDCSAPFGATVCKLTLTYSDDSPQTTSKKLFLKLLAGDDDTGGGKREVAFYQAVMQSGANLPIPKCYHAVYDGALNLLLDDLSETHEPLEHEIPPTERQCYQLMDVLATLHAYWWESPILGAEIGTALSAQAVTDAFHEDIQNYRAFADFLGDRLQPSRRAIYEKVAATFLPIKLKRFTDQRRITLTHGDAHAWNFLYPRSAQDTPRLLDWEAVGVNLGTWDTAYLMAIFWHPERRKWLEKPLMHYYHAQLIKHGVMNYSWEECWQDYRLAVIDLLFMPVWWWKYKTPAFLWWHRLERLMMAYEDLNCEELLG